MKYEDLGAFYLERRCTKEGRRKLAKASGITEKQLLRWVSMADLFRINGAGPEYAELLEASGVDTIPELAQRNAANLADTCAEVNAVKALTSKVPTTTQVENWITQAQNLACKVEY